MNEDVEFNSYLDIIMNASYGSEVRDPIRQALAAIYNSSVDRPDVDATFDEITSYMYQVYCSTSEGYGDLVSAISDLEMALRIPQENIDELFAASTEEPDSGDDGENSGSEEVGADSEDDGESETPDSEVEYESYLDAISNAIYGEEVRGTIRQALEVLHDLLITTGGNVSEVKNAVYGAADRTASYAEQALASQGLNILNYPVYLSDGDSEPNIIVDDDDNAILGEWPYSAPYSEFVRSTYMLISNQGVTEKEIESLFDSNDVVPAEESEDGDENDESQSESLDEITIRGDGSSDEEFTSYLDIISTAVYGEEVRTAINQALRIAYKRISTIGEGLDDIAASANEKADTAEEYAGYVLSNVPTDYETYASTLYQPMQNITIDELDIEFWVFGLVLEYVEPMQNASEDPSYGGDIIIEDGGGGGGSASEPGIGGVVIPGDDGGNG